MSKTLIAYYSRADENYMCGIIKSLVKGNTEVVAEVIHSLTGGDLFKLEQAEEYSKSYNECIEQARHDQDSNARPPLKAYPASIDEYDTVFVGYPNYWSTMPMAVFTFLEHYDFGGKTVIPFCTHEGSGLGRSVEDIKKVCPKAVIKNGLAIRGCSAEKSEKTIKDWLKKENGYDF